MMDELIQILRFLTQDIDANKELIKQVLERIEKLEKKFEDDLK